MVAIISRHPSTASYNPLKKKAMTKDHVEERNGGYYVAGTRVSLDSIVRCFNEGLSPEAILGEFESLSLSQIYGAIAFYLDNQPEIDAYRVRQRQRSCETRNAAEPLPEGLLGRIEEARAQLRSGRVD